MPLVYRTLFAVPPSHDVIELSLTTLSRWLSRGPGGQDVDIRRPGRYTLGRQSTATVVWHQNPDEGVRFLRLKTESERRGAVWRSVVTAVSDPGRATDRTVWIDLTADVLGPGSSEHRIDVSPPDVARMFLRSAPCSDGAAAVGEEPAIVRGRDDRAVESMLAAIGDDARRMAVVVTGSPTDLTVADWQTAMARVLDRAAGMYSGYILDRAAQERVAARLPREFGIPSGGVRTFRPRPRPHDPADSHRHPRLGAQTMDRARSGGRVRPWVGRALMQSVREVVIDTPLPGELRGLDSLLNEEEAGLPARAPIGGPGPAAVTHGAGRAPAPPLLPAPRRDHTTDQTGEVKRRDARIAALEKERDRLLAELAEAMEERDLGQERLRAARHENAWLRTKIHEEGLYALAGARAPVQRSERAPGDFEELLERMTDHAAFPHLHLTIDDPLDDVRELSGNRKERLWATRAWEALRALNDYVRYQLAHPGEGRTLHDYLRDPPEGFHSIPVKRVAAHESDTVRNRAKLSGRRIFRVPTRVHPDGMVPMFAHIKLDAEYGVCPRLYYYPDIGPGRTNRIYIGYLGRHLPVHSTN